MHVWAAVMYSSSIFLSKDAYTFVLPALYMVNNKICIRLRYFPGIGTGEFGTIWIHSCRALFSWSNNEAASSACVGYHHALSVRFLSDDAHPRTFGELVSPALYTKNIEILIQPRQFPGIETGQISAIWIHSCKTMFSWSNNESASAHVWAAFTYSLSIFFRRYTSWGELVLPYPCMRQTLKSSFYRDIFQE